MHTRGVRARARRENASPRHRVGRPPGAATGFGRTAGILATTSVLIATQFLALMVVISPASAASAPSVTGASPIAGPLAGGTSVTITGSGFTGATAVKFGSASAGFTVNSDGQITATAPAGSSATPSVNITVITGAGTSPVSAADEYTYTFATGGYGVILAASTTNPAVGGSVVLTATSNQDVGPTPYGMSIFDVTTGTELVHVGSGTTASATVSQSSAIVHRYVAYICNSGGINIQADSSPVVVTWGTLASPPSVTSVSPSTGPTTGGTSVTISGANLASATSVRFGTAAATISSDTATQIVAVSPAASAGTVDITVTNAAGTSSTSTADQFTYVVPIPTVSQVSPRQGPTAGGTAVTISGTNLTGATGVTFGAAAAASFTVNSATQITATSPAASAGTVDITVTTPSGTSALSQADQFAYLAPPAVTSVSPSSGTTAGGTSVTIGGTNFTAVTSVRFGATSVPNFTVNSATQITVLSPSGAAGTVDITVTTPGGTSALSATDQFTYLVAAPVVTGVSPAAGPTAGGTRVVIAGTSLSGATAVTFGSAAATAFTVNSATQITATAPAGSAGTVDITVTTAGGTSALSAADQFTYVVPAPTVSGISPTSGPTSGGMSVTISGTSLTGASAVMFGSTAASSFTVNSPTQITAVAPAEAAGTVDITVTTPGGTSAASSADRFTFATANSGPPAVTGLSPISGPLAGGTPVIVTGSNFLNATGVMFGSTAASSFTVNSATQITATAPAGTSSASTVDVKVTTPQGTSLATVGDEYTYTFSNNGYAVTLAASTTSPAVGGSVVLTATANKNVGPTPYGLSIFDASTGAELVHVGSGTSTSVTVSQSTAIVQRYVAMICNAKGANAQADSSPVVVTWGTPTPAPTVSSVGPSSGPTTGGTSVTITGTNLGGATAVRFGASAATITSDTTTQIVATSPAAAAGTVDITVTTAGGTSGVSSADQFTYVVAAPTVTGISPTSGPTAGGTSVTITGTSFTGATAVMFGSTAATSFTVNSPTQITAVAPAEAVGTVDITVTTTAGTSAVSPADQFAYVTGPTVASVSPTSGPTAGGTSVTITGTSFTGATAVMFGNTAATSFTVNSATQITAVAPAQAAGTVDLTVTTPGGTSALSQADQFTYLVNTPTVTSISPTSGPTAGGASVTITGTNLTGATAVMFGTTAATSFTVNSATQITAVAPAGAAGTVDLTVTTPGGTSATSPADRYTFVAPPATVTAVGSEVDGTNQPSTAQETLSVSPSAKGDLLTLAIETKFPGTASFTVSGITGGGVATWNKAFAFLTLDGFHGQELWWGVVTSTGPSTLTVSFTSGSTTGTSESATSVDLQEFRSSSGASTVWSVDTTGKVDNGSSSTTLLYPTLTPSSTSELYFGYLAVPGSLSPGSTPGCVYQQDARGNQIVYDTSVSSTITPRATTSTAETWASIGVLFKAQ